MSKPLLELRDVSFCYGSGRPVLRGCSLRVGEGERVGLTGANGSGKTTLLHLAVGLLHPASGEVVAFGKPRRREADFHEVRRRAGLLFQDTDDQLFCPTVAEDVAFGPLNLGRSRAEARRIVAETLERVGLPGFERRITYHLSGGERRLVALASVLAMQPDVLLLDEPTAGLDEAATARLIGVLQRLNQAMLVVSHDRGFRDEVTECSLLLREGGIADILAP